MIFHDARLGRHVRSVQRNRTLAWKAFHAGAVLNANFSRAIRTGATNLSN
jgi:hypothetical protein